MTEDGPAQTTPTPTRHPHAPSTAAPAEPAEEMDLRDAPKVPPSPPPSAPADAGEDRDREHGGAAVADTDRAPT